MAAVDDLRQGGRLDADAALAADLVREAASLAARIRSGGLDVERKTSGSDIVTQADTAAERLVVERLTAERPDDAIVGEEGTSRPGTSGRTWVIDPVDGTYNFVAGLDWWCSAIALLDGDDLVLGAVHHPATGRTFVGGPGLPTTVDGVPVAPLGDRPLAEACMTTYLHPPSYAGRVGAASDGSESDPRARARAEAPTNVPRRCLFKKALLIREPDQRWGVRTRGSRERPVPRTLSDVPRSREGWWPKTFRPRPR